MSETSLSHCEDYYSRTDILTGAWLCNFQGSMNENNPLCISSAVFKLSSLWWNQPAAVFLLCCNVFKPHQCTIVTPFRKLLLAHKRAISWCIPTQVCQVTCNGSEFLPSHKDRDECLYNYADKCVFTSWVFVVGLVCLSLCLSLCVLHVLLVCVSK